MQTEHYGYDAGAAERGRKAMAQARVVREKLPSVINAERLKANATDRYHSDRYSVKFPPIDPASPYGPNYPAPNTSATHQQSPTISSSVDGEGWDITDPATSYARGAIELSKTKGRPLAEIIDTVVPERFRQAVRALLGISERATANATALCNSDDEESELGNVCMDHDGSFVAIGPTVASPLRAA